MKNFSMSGFYIRSRDAAQPSSVNALIRESIKHRIECIIRQHPCCPPAASYEVDSLIQTAERLVGE